MTITIGTRGSKLALRQTHLMAQALVQRNPGVAVSVVTIQSAGDLDRHKPLQEMGSEGVFTKAIEQALLDGRIDLAVHSMKDLPSVLPPELAVCSALKRANPFDCLVLRKGYQTLDDLPPGALFGTSSPRRECCLRLLRPDLQFAPIRGNVETRLKKVETTFYGTVLAAAGLERLGLLGCASHFCTVQEMVPAPAQGVLALEFRKEDSAILECIAPLVDPDTQLASEAERRFLAVLQCSCQTPVGAYACLDGDRVSFHGLYGGGEGRVLQGSITGTRESLVRQSEELARTFLRQWEKKQYETA